MKFDFGGVLSNYAGQAVSISKLSAKVNKDLTQANQKIVKDTVNKLISEQKLLSAARNLFVTTPKTSTLLIPQTENPQT